MLYKIECGEFLHRGERYKVENDKYLRKKYKLRAVSKQREIISCLGSRKTWVSSICFRTSIWCYYWQVEIGKESVSKGTRFKCLTKKWDFESEGLFLRKGMIQVYLHPIHISAQFFSELQTHVSNYLLNRSTWKPRGKYNFVY